MRVQFQFWNGKTSGYYFGRTKEFNDIRHFENYLSFMKRQGFDLDEIWTSDPVMLEYLAKQRKG